MWPRTCSGDAVFHVDVLPDRCPIRVETKCHARYPRVIQLQTMECSGKARAALLTSVIANARKGPGARRKIPDARSAWRSTSYCSGATVAETQNNVADVFLLFPSWVLNVLKRV